MFRTHTRPDVEMRRVHMGLLSSAMILFMSTGKVHGAKIDRAWTLTPPGEDRGDPLKFGQALCSAPDGFRFVVGANAHESFKGVAYIYELVQSDGSRPHHWRRSCISGSDSMQAESKRRGELRLVNRGSGFGFSCAMSREGNVVIIGAPGHNLQNGKVYIFQREERKRKWSEVGSLSAPDGRNGDAFGWALGMSHDAGVIVVSAKGRRANNGEVYIFTRTSQQFDYDMTARVSPPDYIDEPGPHGIRIRNNFGVSLAMSRDGDTFVVGCTGYQSEQGAVYVVSRSSDASIQWSVTQRLVATEPVDFSFFGYKVAIDDNGSTVIVGADGEDDYRGSAYIFQRDASEMNETDTDLSIEYFDQQLQCPPIQKHPLYGPGVKLQAREREKDDNFGGSVSISGDGNVIAVGSPGANRGGLTDSGALYVYSRDEMERSRNPQNATWRLDIREELQKPDLSPGTFFSWTTAISGKGHMLLSSSPDAYGSTGVVRVLSLVDLPRARECTNPDGLSSLPDPLAASFIHRWTTRA